MITPGDSKKRQIQGDEGGDEKRQKPIEEKEIDTDERMKRYTNVRIIGNNKEKNSRFLKYLNPPLKAENTKIEEPPLPFKTPKNWDFFWHA